MAKRKVLILGGGLSALSTGIHLLQEGGAAKFDVTVLTMEHRLGGKAASWRLPDGRYMEIGFHAVFGYYKALQTLLARGGHPVTDPRYFTDNEGVHLMYEASARAVNRLDIPQGPLDVAAFFHNGFIGYRGMSFTEKLEAARWFATTGVRLLTQKVDEALDEHAFTAYAVSTGLALGLTQKSWFRYVLDLAFNFPNEGSAYVGMYGFQRLMGVDSSTVHYVNGPLSEVIVAPIAKLFVDLGGKIEFCTKATRIELDAAARTVKKLFTQATATPVPIPGVVDHVEASPIGGSYSLADAPYPTGDPAPAVGAPEVERSLGVDFDELVCTLPVDSTRALLTTTSNPREAVLEVPELRRIWGLRSVASLSLRVWLPQKCMPSDYTTVVMGTPQPAATIIDYTNRVSELTTSTWGSVVEFEGQEGLHAGLDDAVIVRELLESFVALPFVDRTKVDIAHVMANSNGCHHDFRRNTAHHLRYLLMEPGHWRHRPSQSDTGYRNLVFAGDWMQGTQPTASMEAAVRTGRVAADLLRDREGLPAAIE
ncbi:MAG: FAD-dependent oxidoreductase [Sorangiineae bacterium]|nr:FAD-dependent oxidoreductase [Polyangiaceae bacterium]MEB2322976.1 FAD-dependent oxidoreductase [Sorangiineae bacterium]